MKISEIMETTTAGAVATVSFPMTPGTTKKQQRQAVDPFGHTVNKRKRKESKDPVYNQTIVKR